jgi:D-arabinose 1-dehydrogenase-like Zn-dependent alcohol dehydrogenase
VRRISVGDRVTVPFVCGCGHCGLCIGGNAQVFGQHVCCAIPFSRFDSYAQVCEQQWQPGFHGQGCWAQYVRVPQVLQSAARVDSERVPCDGFNSNVVGAINGGVVCMATAVNT